MIITITGYLLQDILLRDRFWSVSSLIQIERTLAGELEIS